MKHLGTITVLFVLLGAALVANAAEQSEPTRRLVVVVSNGTPNGATVVGDRVTVQFYRGQTLVDSRETAVDDKGEAVFGNLPAGSGLTAAARARHQNMAFAGRPVMLTSTAGPVTARVTVFDVSNDRSKLAVGTHHIIIAVQNKSLEVTEFMQLKNTSEMAVIGSQRDTQNRPMVVEMNLPKGFKNLTPLDYFEQGALVTTATGFYDTMAIPPGEHQATFSYELGIDRATRTIIKRISLPTSELLVFWKGGQGKLTGLGAPAGQLANAQGVPTEYYRREDLAPGDEVSFKISGLGAPDSDTRMWVVLGVVFAAVAVIAIVRLRSGTVQSDS